MPVYKDKKTGKWYYQINYTDSNGKYRQKRKTGFETKKAAQDAEYQAALELNPSAIFDMTFEELATHYLSDIESDIKYSSYYSKESLIRLHIIPFFEGKRAHKIISKDIIEWKKDMEDKGYAFEYLSKAYNNLSAIFNHGVKHYGLKENPCKKVGNFKNQEEVKKQVDFWILDEFKKFISKVIDDIVFKTFFMFLYYMGTRRGEAMALKWTDIDLKTGLVRIYKTYAEKTKEGGWGITSPKTPQSVRDILMPEVLIDQMKKYYEYCKEIEGFNDDCFVFGMFRPLATTTIARKFDEYIKKAKVKRIKVHDLRHSHASLLLNNGVSILVVSQRLGHKDVNETLNTYAHMFPTKEKEAIDIIDNLSKI